MNNLETIKQRLIYALDKSDTPKGFLLDTFEEVYKQGYKDGSTITLKQLKNDVKEQFKNYAIEYGRTCDYNKSLINFYKIITKRIEGWNDNECI